MLNVGLNISQWGLIYGLCVLCALLFLQWRYKHHDHSPSVLFSDVKSTLLLEKTWRMRFVNAPSICKKAAFVLFILALCNPVVSVPKQWLASSMGHLDPANTPSQNGGIENVQIPTEGLAIFFVLDQSGSMRAELDFVIQGLKTQRTTRIDALKFFTSQFINGSPELGLTGRQNDLIGLVAFARVPKVISPLTLDHREVNRLLSEFVPVTHPNEEGTALGYAIYKTAHMIAATEHFAKEIGGEEKPAYDIKSTVMVLVTDGLQNPSSDDLGHPVRQIGVQEAALFAKEKGIRLYIISIQPPIDFMGVPEQIAIQKQAAQLTGGEFYLAGDAQALHRIYRVIDRLERSKHYGTHKNQVGVEESVHSDSSSPFHQFVLYPYLILIGMLLILLAILLETTFLKKVP